jgi:hypothetical protein
MNTEEQTLSTVPMLKETTVKEDGRFLYYYTFSTSNLESKETPEDADV